MSHRVAQATAILMRKHVQAVGRYRFYLCARRRLLCWDRPMSSLHCFSFQRLAAQRSKPYCPRSSASAGEAHVAPPAWRKVDPWCPATTASARPSSHVGDRGQGNPDRPFGLPMLCCADPSVSWESDMTAGRRVVFPSRFARPLPCPDSSTPKPGPVVPGPARPTR